MPQQQSWCLHISSVTLRGWAGQIVALPSWILWELSGLSETEVVTLMISIILRVILPLS